MERTREVIYTCNCENSGQVWGCPALLLSALLGITVSKLTLFQEIPRLELHGEWATGVQVQLSFTGQSPELSSHGF